MRRGVVALLLVLGACSGSESGSRSDNDLACDHWANISADADAGLLTDAEIRDKLKEVYENTAIADSSVQNAARAMLSAATQGDGAALTQAAIDMNEACFGS